MTKETKEERFKRVAEKRVQNAIHSIRSLSQLANTKIYKWNNDQLEKIWQAIDKEIEGCKKIFKNPDEGLFKL
jgi:predicted transcriptional regulator